MVDLQDDISDWSSVAPYKPKLLEIAEFIKLIRDLSPSSIDKQGTTIRYPHKFDWHYLLPKQPARILGIIKDMKYNDPNSQTDIFYYVCRAVQECLNDDKQAKYINHELYKKIFVEFEQHNREIAHLGLIRA